jgi:sirohydrochlorin ferrochelatase
MEWDDESIYCLFFMAKLSTTRNEEVSGLQGLLVIAHGSSNPGWVALVEKAVNQVDIQIPVVTSFLEMVEGRFIQDGIDQLEVKGVTRIIVIPLFVSSGSTHIQEIRYLLGLPQEIELEVDEEPLHMNAEVEMVAPMDDHPLILEIMEKRVRELSTNPEEETLLLVGHGSKIDSYYAIWKSMMERMAERLQERVGLKEAFCATLLPDQLHDQLEELVHHRVLVVPLFLSEGYFTKKVIPSRMEGINCEYSGKTYLPDPLISEWIKAVAMEKSDL